MPTPAFDWTEDRQLTATRMRAAGCSQDQIAQCIGCGQTTVHKYFAQKDRRPLSEQPEPVMVERPDVPGMLWDKKEGEWDWREMCAFAKKAQALKHKASFNQKFLHIDYSAFKRPFPVMWVSDWHWLSYGTDHEALEAFTDAILETPDLMIGLIGDLAQMSIKLRSVMEVADNILPPSLQHKFTESWVADMAPRILCATWENHGAEREEKQSGYSRETDILARIVPYFDGIGHMSLKVGSCEYNVAMSHKFRGRSFMNPIHSHQRYARYEWPDADLIVSGDSHIYGIGTWTDGPHERTAVNCGSLQTSSGFGNRYFSLFTHKVFPVTVFDPTFKRITAYPDLDRYLVANHQELALAA